MVDFTKSDMMMIMGIFIGLIITATLIVSIADQVSLTTSTLTEVNTTITGLVVDTNTDIEGRALTATPGATVIDRLNASDYTTTIPLVSGRGAGGLLSVQLRPNTTATNVISRAVNVSYSYEPDGFISDAGGRNVTVLITLFAALAMVVFVIVMLFKGSLMEMINRMKV